MTNVYSLNNCSHHYTTNLTIASQYPCILAQYSLVKYRTAPRLGNHIGALSFRQFTAKWRQRRHLFYINQNEDRGNASILLSRSMTFYILT